MRKKEVMNEHQVKRSLTRIAHEILELNKGAENLAIIGIRTRGVHLAERLSKKISEIEDVGLPIGIIDITLYRDDLSDISTHPKLKKTDIPFKVGGKNIILVDDVLYTGRSIRAAIDVLMDLGRPASIQLAVLVDRGHREFPIKADYVGKVIPTTEEEVVKVMLKEEDGQDLVIVQDA